jgi:uncharacterized damage-inducible protein DinB
MMNEAERLNPTFSTGWQTYQTLLMAALRPLSAEQLALRAAPGLRSIGEIATHMIGARARWFRDLLGEGGEEKEAFADLGTWDRRGMPERTSMELVRGLETTWQGMQAAIARWTPAEWEETYPGEEPGDPEVMTRLWIIWHLIEHDLHHGGEISLILGAHGLAAPDL